jgi:Glyoxalase/Bleomycin resistance protein/Dioxygenase superfamily
MLQRIDMVAIYVRDWERQLAWYQERLGFAAVHVEHHHRFAVLALPGGGPRARGVRILEVEDDTDDGYRLARLADPEGNELNVYAVST